MGKEERMKKMQQIIAKAWMDEGFKKRLLSDPAAVLKEQGLETPPGVEIRIVENTDKVFHLVLPPKPSSGELPDASLDTVAAGALPSTLFPVSQ